VGANAKRYVEENRDMRIAVAPVAAGDHHARRKDLNDPAQHHPRRRRLLARPRREGSGRGRPDAVAPLEHGTELGKPTVTFRVDLPDGKVVLAQTTLLFLSAADAFKARLGDPRT
jgi:hypothetical protein